LNYTPGSKFEDPEAAVKNGEKKQPTAKGKYDLTIPEEPSFLKPARISAESHKQ
jgi:hypothetical protein